MQSTFFNVLATTVLLAGCAETLGTKPSRMEWLDALKKTRVVDETADALIPSNRLKIFKLKTLTTDLANQPIDQIIHLVADQVPGGVLITATGVTTRTGSYNGQFTTLDSADSSVLEYQFNVFQPPSSNPENLETRKVTIAKFLTDQDLTNISLIRVRSASNRLSARP